jgi:hypothetical protein
VTKVGWSEKRKGRSLLRPRLWGKLQSADASTNDSDDNHDATNSDDGGDGNSGDGNSGDGNNVPRQVSA